jgi:hypothetical protein
MELTTVQRPVHSTNRSFYRQFEISTQWNSYSLSQRFDFGICAFETIIGFKLSNGGLKPGIIG